MKTIKICISVIGVMLFCVPALYAVKYEVNNVILIDDFDDLTTENGLGGETQGDEENVEGCIPSFTQDPYKAFGLWGHSLRLDYDVTFPGSFSFYWTKLGLPGATTDSWETRDLSQFDYFSFWYSSEDKIPSFSLETHKDNDGDKMFILGNDTSSKVPLSKYIIRKKEAPGVWYKVTVPFSHFKDMVNWTNIFEFVFVFENSMRSGKGTVYMDDILIGSNYHLTEKKPEIKFPGRMYMKYCMVNNKRLIRQFALKKSNRFDIVMERINPLLESIRVEMVYYGEDQWHTILTFYDHTSGLYDGYWQVDADTRSSYLFRIVATDILGREEIIAGPFNGLYKPSSE